MLARLPDAPAGTRGLSLFLVPKFLVKADGSLGARNDVRCAGIEHKLGIHASPTCVMVYGDSGGATGYLVGEENKGLAAMFVMMNSARLAVGLQGVAIGERAYQHALAYARERRQGREPRPRRHGADPRSSRRASHALDDEEPRPGRARHLPSDGHRDRPLVSCADQRGERATAADRAALLTPIAKAYSSEIGDHVASKGVQMFGGMGYIEETGAAQFMRDARIAAIYEGANGIQAIDLVQRKIRSGGRRRRSGARSRAFARSRPTSPRAAAKRSARPRAASMRPPTRWTSRQNICSRRSRAIPPTRWRAQRPICAFSASRSAAPASPRPGSPNRRRPNGAPPLGRVALARFFAEKLATAAPGLAETVLSGDAALKSYESALQEFA